MLEINEDQSVQKVCASSDCDPAAGLIGQFTGFSLQLADTYFVYISSANASYALRAFVVASCQGPQGTS
jgi:hypothetical protein